MYATLAALVATGVLTGADQWASDHLMPWANPSGNAPTFLESLVPLYHAGLSSTSEWVSELVTLPAQVAISFVLIAAAAAVLRRRGRSVAGAAWLAAWALGTAIEVVCKHALVRPALYLNGIHLTGFDQSWPSGHTLRAALVALALGAAWPRLRPLLAVWFAAAVCLLVAGGYHTPSDVAGGLALAILLAALAGELERSGLLRRRAALRTARGAAPAGRRR